ncbi:NUDIX hydrolase [Undibacterium fentianense]|uniref:NUDIX hydrolase n=1 Tax=Undibacterium fentianense TaxID=2828728 RepID=A0A941E0P5_9BURK|nr:NUDIX hydrolase [Undibacterium fentianense]MBR7799206.1 NUDIX hydrolase [Undibacterium fentianense]
MKFCSSCAAPVALKIPDDDTRERFVCTQCGMIHYQNPNMVVGSVPVWDIQGEVKVLLCKRAIEPRYGYWTLPAGFMENQESCRQAAQRETIEEAGANIELHELFSVLSVPHVDQVHLFYRASLIDTNFHAGTESLAVQLFSEKEIPWDEIAFPTVAQTLKFFFEDLRQTRLGSPFRLHEHDFHRSIQTD